MPSRHADTRQAATYRFPRALLASARRIADERGEAVTAVLEAALERYVAEHAPTAPVFMPPPPAQH